jgi:transposase-like protein
MRYTAAEKLEIIRLVEQSHTPVRRTLAHLGIPPATFPLWCELHRTGGPEALEDWLSGPAASGTASPARCARTSSTWH